MILQYGIILPYVPWTKLSSSNNEVFVELENTKIKQDQYSRELNKRWAIHAIRMVYELFSSATRYPFFVEMLSEIRFQLEGHSWEIEFSRSMYK